MANDHSLTYRIFTFRNIPHILRLQSTIKILTDLGMHEDDSIIDFGCSNGFITNKIKKHFNLRRARGLDLDIENIKIAKKNYPDINFSCCNLNKKYIINDSFSYVLCFETLEHVGSISRSIENLIECSRKSKYLIISVPIETGILGLIKFCIKNFLYKDKFNEISKSKLKYFIYLFLNRRISIFRDKREFWSSHYGFDFREIQDYLNKNYVKYQLKKRFTTVYFIIDRALKTYSKK